MNVKQAHIGIKTVSLLKNREGAVVCSVARFDGSKPITAAWVLSTKNRYKNVKRNPE